MQYESFFQKICGFLPRAYQTRLGSELLAGHNVVAVAPTGAGKTIAALAPFFYAKQQGKPLADRVLYALPLRSLTSALHKSVSETFKHIGNPYITIQMGNQPEDPFFEGDVVFTTIDQLLSAYVGLPYGTSRASANIPPGALVGALVVIDEFHLLSYQEALPTFLDMMTRLHPYTQFLVMTATVPDTQVQKISAHLKGVSVQLNQEEMRELPKKTRVLHWQDSQINAETVLQHAGTKTLVVVNTVYRAQTLFLSLKKLLAEQGRDMEIRCLHSQLFNSERNQTEEWILDRFRRGAEEPSLLIATQVVEAGLDISADVLITELCPANALLQRIGRCARFEGETGTIHVCSVRGEKGRQDRPYETELMEKSEELLKQQERVVLHPEWEQQLIEHVHGEYDSKQLRAALSQWQDRKTLIDKSYVNGNPSMSRLVRNVDSLNVLVHDQPESLRMELRPERCSVHFRKVESFLRKHFAERREDQSGAVGWYLTFEEVEWKRESAVWKAIHSADDLKGKLVVCLSPEFVQYQAGVGLMLTIPEGGTSVFSKETLQEPERSSPRYAYVRETYLEHVRRIRELYADEEVRGVYQVANRRLSDAIGLSASAGPAMLAEFTGALHDIGKLTVGYQQALNAWQRDRRGEQETAFLAHSDFSHLVPGDLEESKLRQYRRPNHAVEGSSMAIPILAQLGKQAGEHGEWVVKAMALAIMRHHYAFSSEATHFQVAAGATPVVQESLHGLIDGSVVLADKSYKYDFHTDLHIPELLVLYWYFVRRLRLNDRRSQERLALESKSEVNPSHAV